MRELTRKFIESKNLYCHNIKPTGPVYSKQEYMILVENRLTTKFMNIVRPFIKTNNALWEQRRLERNNKLKIKQNK